MLEGTQVPRWVEKWGGVPGPNFSDIVIFRRFSGTFSADFCGRGIFKLMGKSFSTNMIKSLSTNVIYNELYIVNIP